MATVPEVSLDRQAICEPESRCRVERIATKKGWFAVMLAHFSLWNQRLEQRRRLACLSDELLRDVGITREVAEREVAKWFWQE